MSLTWGVAGGGGGGDGAILWSLGFLLRAGLGGEVVVWGGGGEGRTLRLFFLDGKLKVGCP